jgi:hypothetical protein
MADIEPNDLPIAESIASPCRHLRTKGMYVFSDGPPEGGDDEDDHAIYWCLKTMKNFGPDDEMVGGRECREASRSCYEPL